MELTEPLLKGRPPISGYGRGGFRLGGIEHPGSILIFPHGVYAWPIGDADELTEDAFRPVFDQGEELDFLILGTGIVQIFPAASLRGSFASVGIGLEAMDTGAACRTYNVLLAEERIFAAGLITVS